MLATATLGLTACTGSGADLGSGEANTVSGDLAAGIDETIESAMQQSGSTAAIVGVWTADGGEYVRSYGDEELDPNHHIRGAQATQPVVCALLLDLAASGDIDLDREVSQDLTRQVGIEGVTYRQLCQAKSGLADFKGAFTDINANNPIRPFPDRELLAEAIVRSPESWPGLDVHISDANAVLLARTLRVDTGESLSDLLDNHVFSKADMDSSYFPAGGELTPQGASMEGYTYPKSGGDPVCDVDPVAVPEVSPTMLGGAGGTVTTVTDLKNFYESYLGGEFGGDEFSGLVTETTPTKNPERDDDGEPIVEEGEEDAEPDPATRQWGFGLENYGSLYGYSGAITGTLTAAYHDPEAQFTVVVSLNNSTAGAPFTRYLGLELSSIAAESGAGFETPWTAEDRAEQRAERAVCQSDED